MKNYYYGNNVYQTLDEAQAAADAMLVTLQTNPSEWCVVKRLEVADDGSFIVPNEALSNTDILNLADGIYSIYSPISGENILGVDAVDALAAINRLQAEFAAMNNVSVIRAVEYLTTNADFSAYEAML